MNSYRELKSRVKRYTLLYNTFQELLAESKENKQSEYNADNGPWIWQECARVVVEYMGAE